MIRSGCGLDGMPARLWRLVSLACHRLLMLDYDGTLAPFRVARHEARPVPASMQLLHRIAAGAHTRLAIVSGRPLHDLEPLIGSLPALVVGEYGWECRASDGTLVRRPLDRTVEETIEAAEHMARGSGWGGLLERKRTALVLHTRALPRDRAMAIHERCVETWGGLVWPGRVAVDRIDGGVEIRATGRNKGTTALSLLSQAPPGTLGVFVGDDVTDEEAFEVVRDWGFGVRVGDPHKPSFAMGRVPSCESVSLFLERWLAVVEGRSVIGPDRGGWDRP